MLQWLAVVITSWTGLAREETMKELLQLLSVLPAPSPTTGLEQAIKQHAEILNQHTAAIHAMQQQMDYLARSQFHTTLLAAFVIGVVSVTLVIVFHREAKKLRHRVAKLERHLLTLPVTTK
jgi:hypothetical protein